MQEMQVWSPGWEDPLEEGMKNPLDGGVWRATVHGVTKSWKWLKQPSTHPYRLE